MQCSVLRSTGSLLFPPIQDVPLCFYLLIPPSLLHALQSKSSYLLPVASAGFVSELSNAG